jgi:hypothetical protein
MKNIKYDSPYCKLCGACGEDGCCSAMMCKSLDQGQIVLDNVLDGCEYSKTYLRELKEGYEFMNSFYALIYDKLSDDIKNEVDVIYNNIV